LARWLRKIWLHLNIVLKLASGYRFPLEKIMSLSNLCDPWDIFLGSVYYYTLWWELHIRSHTWMGNVEYCNRDAINPHAYHESRILCPSSICLVILFNLFIPPRVHQIIYFPFCTFKLLHCMFFRVGESDIFLSMAFQAFKFFKTLLNSQI